ncbi:MAG: hypothetical protein ACLGSD_09990 [Acidobacteriota bacterium]
MAIHPDTTFPVSPKDQADVIRIYIELMRERHGDRREADMLLDRPLGPRYGSRPTRFSNDSLDGD